MWWNGRDDLIPSQVDETAIEQVAKKMITKQQTKKWWAEMVEEEISWVDYNTTKWHCGQVKDFVTQNYRSEWGMTISWTLAKLVWMQLNNLVAEKIAKDNV